jgi:polysaccharide export outer membrane protein
VTAWFVAVVKPLRIAFVFIALDASSLAAQTDTADLPVLLRPNDVLRITVWRQAELSGEFRVGEDGSIRHPILRDVSVLGASMSEVEARVRAVLERFETNPQFVIEPLVGVFVGGDVRVPDLYYLPPETTVSQAVAQAGGPVSGRELEEAVLFRDGERIELDLREVPTGLGARVRSGDQVTIEWSPPFFSTYVSPALSVISVVTTLVFAFTR